MSEWISAFDGLLLVDPETGESIDMGDALREEADSIDSGTEALLVPIANRIQSLSEQLVEAASGWGGSAEGPTDTGISTPDVQFVIFPADGDITCVERVYGPYSLDEAAHVRSQLHDCVIVPVVQWVK